MKVSYSLGLVIFNYSYFTRSRFIGFKKVPLNDIFIILAAKLKRKHPIPSNDDLLYDPDADDADQSWVDRQRQIYQVPAVIPPGSTNAPKTKLPKSDAILNCPACMVQLCLDCQRYSLIFYCRMVIANRATDSHIILYLNLS